jgi:hypothetical protein
VPDNDYEQLGRRLVECHRSGFLAAGVGSRLVADAAAVDLRRREAQRMLAVSRRLVVACEFALRSVGGAFEESARKRVETVLAELGPSGQKGGE